MILLVEIHIPSNGTGSVATLGMFAVEGNASDALIVNFGVEQCSIPTGKQRTAKRVMSAVAPTIVSMWPDYLNFDQVWISTNSEKFSEKLKQHGSQRRWYTLTDTRPFDSGLSEKWIEVKTYGKTKKGIRSKRATQIDYIRSDRFVQSVESVEQDEPQTLFDIIDDDSGCDWDVKRYSSHFSTGPGQEIKRYTCYKSFGLVDKVSKSGKQYVAITKAPCPAPSPWQAVDRLCYSFGGFKAIYRPDDKQQLSSYRLNLELSELTLDSVEELEF